MEANAIVLDWKKRTTYSHISISRRDIYMGRRKVFGPALPPAMAKARSAAKRAARKAAPAVKTKTAQVALIKSVIANVEETKYRSELIASNVTFDSQITTPHVIRLLPRLVQDQGAGRTYERLGMKIRPQKLRVVADVCLTPVSRSSAIVVCYWVLQSKNVKQTANLLLSNGVDMNTFLRTGDSAETQLFNGFVEDASLPVNTAQFTVMKHGKFMLAKNTGTIQDSSSTGNQPLAGQPIKHTLDFTLNTPKVFTYAQDNNVPRVEYYPNGYAPFIVFGYYHQDHTTPDSVNQDITVNLRSHLWYDDA